MRLARLGGCSVTQRIRMVRQPRGGYLNPKSLRPEILGDGEAALNPDENVNPGLVGLAVDYMTRFMSGTPSNIAFAVSLKGASIVGEDAKAAKILSRIRGLDDASLANAVRLVGFDVCFRAGVMGYRPVGTINPDAETIENVRTMVERSLHFLDVHGPKVLDGFTFEGGYTRVVSAGDGDFTTADTLWDFKVSKSPVKKEHTLQLLMYWRMGVHSIHPEFRNLKYLGIYNPRANTAYRYAIEGIPPEVVEQVDRHVLCYEE